MISTLKQSIIEALHHVNYQPQHVKPTFEIECRLGYPVCNGKQRFDPDIGKTNFMKIKNALSETGFVMKYEQTTDKIYKVPSDKGLPMNVRITSYKDEPNKWVSVIKNKVYNVDHPNIQENGLVRVSVSTETPYPNFVAPTRSETTLPFVRKKKRTSFIADIFSIDMSEVNVNSKITYEVEVELKNTDYVLNEMPISDIADAFVQRLQVVLDAISQK